MFSIFIPDVYTRTYLYILYLFIFGFRLVTGFPNCKNRQKWVVYNYTGSSDRLVLYPNGKLRHYVLKHQQHTNEEQQQRDYIIDHERYFDYEQEFYCLDKVNYYYF
jgi:G protein-coupled receptor Mth (Methuselah protein)